jgi:hypothetical protein
MKHDICIQKMLSFFDDLTDPRVDRIKLHSVKDIIGITICAVISGCDDWDEIELYGQQKSDWLKQFLELLNGIPNSRGEIRPGRDI